MHKIIKTVGLYILFPIVLIGIIWTLFPLISSAKIISKSAVAITAIEELSNLEVVKYQLDLILDETEKKDFLWIDILNPDNKFLMSVSGEASACIDLRNFNSKNIKETGPNTIEITLPSPNFCGLPSVDSKTMKIHIKSGFQGDKFMEQNLQTLTEKLKEKALNNGILIQAKKSGEKSIKALLKPILKDVEVSIKFEEETPKINN